MVLSICQLGLLAVLLVAANAQTACRFPWEKARGDACYGNTNWYVSPAKSYSSDYVRLPGGLVYYGPVTGAAPNTGLLNTNIADLAVQSMRNLINLAESSGASKMDILRNPVRAYDQATLTNDPNNALVIRANLAVTTEQIYGLRNAANQVDWPKYPSNQEKRPPGRSYVIMPNDEIIVMQVTAFTGSNRDYTHDFASEQQTIQFNNLPFNWTSLSTAEQLELEANSLRLSNGQAFHYPSPTSLSYTPNFTICDGPSHVNAVPQCRTVALRSCERAFSLLAQDDTRVRNAAGLVVGGQLRWKGQRYNCTDVINYNNGGALWCRIRDDQDIAVAYEIAEAHHINGAANLGFSASDDVLVDLFLTNPATQYQYMLDLASRRYAAGKWPAIQANFGRLVGGDKIELTGEHSTGTKYYASNNANRRVTAASLEGWNTVRVGSEAYGTAHSAHVCNATVCSLPSTHEGRVHESFANAFADLRSVDHDGAASVTAVYAFVDESLYSSIYKPLVVSAVQQFWSDEATRPVVFIEPHRGLWPYASNTAGRTIQGPNTITINLRSVKQIVPGRY